MSKNNRALKGHRLGMIFLKMGYDVFAQASNSQNNLQLLH